MTFYILITNTTEPCYLQAVDGIAQYFKEQPNAQVYFANLDASGNAKVSMHSFVGIITHCGDQGTAKRGSPGPEIEQVCLRIQR